MQKINTLFLSFLHSIEEKLIDISAQIEIIQHQNKSINLLSFEYSIREIQFWQQNFQNKLDACAENLKAQIAQMSKDKPLQLNYYETKLQMNQNLEIKSFQIDNIFDIQINNPFEMSLYKWENQQLEYLSTVDFKNYDNKFKLDEGLKVKQQEEVHLVIMIFGDVKVNQKQQLNQSNLNFELSNNIHNKVKKVVEIQRLQDKELNFLDMQDTIKLSVNQHAFIIIQVFRSFYLKSFYHPAIQREKPVGMSFAWQQQTQQLIFRINIGIDLNGDLLHEQKFDVENQMDDLVEFPIIAGKYSTIDGILLRQDQQYILSIEQLNMACFYYSYKNEQPNIYFQTIEVQQQNQFLKSHNKKGIFPKFKFII